jgi:hypothetical protein
MAVKKKSTKRFSHASAPRRFRIRVTAGNNAAGLFVSEFSGTLIPTTKWRLCLEEGAAIEYFEAPARLRQTRLKALGFTTQLEKVVGRRRTP